MDVSRGSSQHVGLQLPPALQLHILSFLPPNDRALSGRLVSPDAAAGLSGPQHFTASLSQPLPTHAAPWAVEAGRQHMRQLPFRHKLQLLCTAAASGSEVNLEVALALLRPGVFPEVLHRNLRSSNAYLYVKPGVAAVKAGHPELLGWLLRHCPALLADCRDILRAAAWHCDLAGLQAVWATLGLGDYTAFPPFIDQEFLATVAASPVDAVAKVEWVLAEGWGSCSLQESTAVAAARSGDLGRLLWLRDRGCPMDLSTLESALQHADLAVAQWIVDEAGCELPVATAQAERWRFLLFAAAKSPDGVQKLQWLRERGAPPLGGDRYTELLLGSNRDSSESGRDGNGKLVLRLLRSAAEAGQAEVLRHLLSIAPPTAMQHLVADQELIHCAVASGSIPTAELLRQAGCTPCDAAYAVAAAAAARTDRPTDDGHVAMIRWLAREARVPAAGTYLPVMLQVWPNDTPADSRDLLEAVQVLVGEAGCKGWDARMALISAAPRGELALVQYLLRQTPGCQPGWDLIMGSADSGCEALLEWLVQQHPGCMEDPVSGVSPYVSAAARGDLGTLTALRRLGVPRGAEDVVMQAGREGAGVPALQWLVEQGARVWPEDEEDRAVAWEVYLGTMEPQTAAWLRGLAAAGQGSGSGSGAGA